MVVDPQMEKHVEEKDRDIVADIEVKDLDMPHSVEEFSALITGRCTEFSHLRKYHNFLLIPYSRKETPHSDKHKFRFIRVANNTGAIYIKVVGLLAGRYPTCNCHGLKMQNFFGATDGPNQYYAQRMKLKGDFRNQTEQNQGQQQFILTAAPSTTQNFILNTASQNLTASADQKEVEKQSSSLSKNDKKKDRAKQSARHRKLKPLIPLTMVNNNLAWALPPIQLM
uniref:Uncharacterized protein n=1 Tax=Romanomermis culicivorax TaxID=13658 RepID=A0A915LAB3_ROMCU